MEPPYALRRYLSAEGERMDRRRAVLWMLAGLLLGAAVGVVVAQLTPMPWQMAPAFSVVGLGAAGYLYLRLYRRRLDQALRSAGLTPRPRR